MNEFTIAALPPDIANAIRSGAAAGHIPAVRSVADGAGYPCRQCLRDVEPGDDVLLVSYQPFRGESPYAAPSPVFIHAADCGPHPDEREVPDQLRTRLLSVRAYDTNHRMRGADVVEGKELEPMIDRLFADPEVRYLHVHYARPGCFACRVDRL